jgi:hypothetical protein
MHKSFPSNTNCWSLGSGIYLEHGIALGPLASGELGVPLARVGKKQRLGIHIGECCVPVTIHEDRRTLCAAWLTQGNVLCGPDSTSPPQTLVYIPRILEIEVDRGDASVTVGFAAGPHPLHCGHPVRHQKGRSGILSLGHAPEGTMDMTAVRVRAHGRSPFVIGLTVTERDKNSQPHVWVHSESNYRAKLREALRNLEHILSGHRK